MTQSKSPTGALVWYCARTKPKQEHLAAANVRKNLSLEVFLPRLRLKRNTRRGMVAVTEPLFPCYIFVQAPLGSTLDEIRFTGGISSLVHFGQMVPTVPDCTIAELKKCFAQDELLVCENAISLGSEVHVVNGAFSHLSGIVIRCLPAKSRVQVLLDILGRSTVVEIDQKALLREKCSIAALLPELAA